MDEVCLLFPLVQAFSDSMGPSVVYDKLESHSLLVVLSNPSFISIEVFESHPINLSLQKILKDVCCSIASLIILNRFQFLLLLYLIKNLSQLVLSLIYVCILKHFHNFAFLSVLKL